MRTIQGTFDDLGTPLHDVTFVVVDVETTGSGADRAEITEIGAVKVRGGERLGEFQTLVRPSAPIPALIQVLTGITDAMVAGAPRLSQVLPLFLDFARDCVLVAHNAPFDVGFLKAGAARLDLPWPGFAVLDTVKLARALVPRDEAPNHKLGTLAALFGAEQTPDHRALHDARATVDVLHALIGRVGNLGVASLEELLDYTTRVPDAVRRKRHLAADLPSAPGVYLFKDTRGRVLYVGTSRDVRRRVHTYFTTSEKRRRMRDMVALAESVTAIECPTALEAQVRELRLIAEHDPPFNRRSRRPARRPWVKLTIEPFPRLAVVGEVRDDGADYLGPFRTRADARLAVDALHEAYALRRCTTRLSTRRRSAACALAEMRRCLAPCLDPGVQPAYSALAATVGSALAGDLRPVGDAHEARMAELAAQERFEEAAEVRDRILALVSGATRTQRVRPLATGPELVAARRRSEGGWEVACIRYGRLAGTAVTPRGADPMPLIAALRAGAEAVTPPVAPAPATTPEETELLLAWLERDDVRLVHLDGAWTSPAYGARGLRRRLAPPADSAAPPGPAA